MTAIALRTEGPTKRFGSVEALADLEVAAGAFRRRDLAGE